jgi:hypothetical protein
MEAEEPANNVGAAPPSNGRSSERTTVVQSSVGSKQSLEGIAEGSIQRNLRQRTETSENTQENVNQYRLSNASSGSFRQLEGKESVPLAHRNDHAHHPTLLGAENARGTFNGSGNTYPNGGFTMDLTGVAPYVRARSVPMLEGLKHQAFSSTTNCSATKTLTDSYTGMSSNSLTTGGEAIKRQETTLSQQQSIDHPERSCESVNAMGWARSGEWLRHRSGVVACSGVERCSLCIILCHGHVAKQPSWRL